jgi:hypothetical protein
MDAINNEFGLAQKPSGHFGGFFLAISLFSAADLVYPGALSGFHPDCRPEASRPDGIGIVRTGWMSCRFAVVASASTSPQLLIKNNMSTVMSAP